MSGCWLTAGDQQTAPSPRSPPTEEEARTGRRHGLRGGLGEVSIPCSNSRMAWADIIAVIALVCVLAVVYAARAWPGPAKPGQGFE